MNRKLKNEELNRISKDEFRESEKAPVIVVLDNIRSINNVGSVFRTSDAFRVEAIYLCGITATPEHREIQKTALGAQESVKWKYFEKTTDAIDELSSKGYSSWAIEQTENSSMLNNWKNVRENPVALVFGNEVFGVEQEVIDKCEGVIEIPQLGTKHSLNISVSAGIVIWEAVKNCDLFD